MRVHESETVEFKKSLSQTEPALKAVCGFLNYHGGIISFGRANDGRVTGVEPTDHTLRKLSQQISSRIKPEITPDIRVIKEDEKSIIVVTVPEGNNKPYFLDGIAYVRSGTENKVISPDELKRIILNSYSLPWDEQACHGATVNDIDQDAVRTFLKKANEERRCNINPELPLEISLDKLGIINNGIPTNAAVLFFGKEPQRFIIQSEVRCARFKGEEISGTYISMSVLQGRLDQIIEDTNQFIIKTINKSAQIIPGKMQREERWEYPLVALREAVINAICHRDYQVSGNVQVRIFDSGLQVWNPGLLPDGITIAILKIEHASRPRNKKIAWLLFLSGYIEQWGSGTLNMLNACRTEGSPEPEFKEAGDDFVVTFERSSAFALLKSPEILNERQHKSIQYLKDHTAISIRDYSNLYGCNIRAARRDLSRLLHLGIVAAVRKGKQTDYSLHESLRTLQM